MQASCTRQQVDKCHRPGAVDIDIQGKELYEIEYIRCAKLKDIEWPSTEQTPKGIWVYRVHWYGWPDSDETWEPEDHFAHSARLLLSFEKEVGITRGGNPGIRGRILEASKEWIEEEKEIFEGMRKAATEAEKYHQVEGRRKLGGRNPKVVKISPREKREIFSADSGHEEPEELMVAPQSPSPMNYDNSRSHGDDDDETGSDTESEGGTPPPRTRPYVSVSTNLNGVVSGSGLFTKNRLAVEKYGTQPFCIPDNEETDLRNTVILDDGSCDTFYGDNGFSTGGVLDSDMQE